MISKSILTQNDVFFRDVIEGLSKPQKTLPCKYFYDKIGTELFNQICETEEYYVTRTELSIMQQYAHEMAESLGTGCLLVELGSGSFDKTKLLLEQLKEPAGFVPIDISPEQLEKTSTRVHQLLPQLDVWMVCADFTESFDIPIPLKTVNSKTIYFPGSTIGNFNPMETDNLLRTIGDACSPGDGLLIGIDLIKDGNILYRAYNDKDGYTAAFNLNLLHRINRELDADFQVSEFEHLAFFNEWESRMEIYLVSKRNQKVTIQDEEFSFYEGETIHTEYSYKYDIDDFCRRAEQVHFHIRNIWTDPDHFFGVLYLEYRP